LLPFLRFIIIEKNKEDKMKEKYVKDGWSKMAEEKEGTTEKWWDTRNSIGIKLHGLETQLGGDATIGPVEKFVKKLKLLYNCVNDYMDGRYKEIPWSTIAGIIFALLYFLNPFDLIPDVVPGVGYIDDATVLLIVWEAVKEDLKKYAQWKGYNLSEYF
jgi:uncharacterized membrane protein YkvA (DUF1232 family)